jgi:hypothetical protein
MTKYLGSMLVLLAAAACGGTTEGDPANGAGSAGRAGNAGSSGNAGAGGTTAQTGGSGNSGGIGGSSVNSGGSGVNSGGSGVDPGCPARKPNGACTAANLTCEYNPESDCLCYTTPNPTFFCTQVDGTCRAEVGGAGGFSTKIAIPAHQYCTCSSGEWACRYGL